MPNARYRRNERAREQITTIIEATPSGSIIHPAEILDAPKFKFRGYSKTHVGSLLKERDDVKWESSGLWRVV